MTKEEIQDLYNVEMERRRIAAIRVRADSFAYSYQATKAVFQSFNSNYPKFHESGAVDIFPEISLLHRISYLKTFKEVEKIHIHFSSKIKIFGLGNWGAKRFMRITF